MGEEEVPRRRGARQGARPRRPRPHRAGGRSPRVGIRHDDHRPRSVRLGTDGSPTGRGTGRPRRAVLASRLRLAPHAVHRPHASSRQCRTTGEGEERHPHRQHRARRPHRRSGAWPTPSKSGQVAGAALDVFEKEPTVDHRLQMLPQVVATPHIAASTREGQELVGAETAAALRDFLQGRRHPQRGQLPLAVAGGVQATATLCGARGTAWHVHRTDERRAHSRGEPSLLRRTGAEPDRRHRQRRSCRPVQARALNRRHRRQRPKRGRRARHRNRRVAQHPRAKLHQPDLAEDPDGTRANAGSRARSSKKARRAWCWWMESPSKRHSKAR